MILFFVSLFFSIFFTRKQQHKKRHQKNTPATGPKDDYYLNLLDWSAEDQLAAGREARTAPRKLPPTRFTRFLIGSVMGEKLPEKKNGSL